MSVEQKNILLAASAQCEGAIDDAVEIQPGEVVTFRVQRQGLIIRLQKIQQLIGQALAPANR